ncbi:MAG: hypothetical protein AB8B85_21330, partial [Paracoccaceae bacterium]
RLSVIADRISSMVMLALAGLVVLDKVLGQDWAGLPSRVLAVVLMIAVTPRFGLREWALLVLAIALSWGLWQRESIEDLTFALGQGAYFAGFILLLMLLREAAVTSPAVKTVGHWLTHQRPGRRFVATWAGGHMAGILMNFGAVSLLAPLVQRGVRAEPIETAEDERLAQVRERRALSALIRGFAPVITWAPTTLTQVIILGSVPGLDPLLAMAYGMGMGLIMLGIGWAEDRLRWGKPRAIPDTAGPFPRRAGLDLLAVYALLILGAFSVQQLAGVSLPQALMTVAPMMLFGWVLSQNHGNIPATGQRLTEIAATSIPRLARDAYLLGAAGFIGICAARLAPIELFAAWTESAHLAPWMIVALIPVLITLGGQIALSPMMMVVFLAAVLSALPELPAAPEHIAVGLAAGWMLSLTASPNATGALLIAGATGRKSTEITWKWNGVYSLAALTAFAVFCLLFV